MSELIGSVISFFNIYMAFGRVFCIEICVVFITLIHVFSIVILNQVS